MTPVHGDPVHINGVARYLEENVYLRLATRGVTVLLVPFLTWMGGQLISLESEIATIKDRFDVRISVLETKLDTQAGTVAKLQESEFRLRDERIEALMKSVDRLVQHTEELEKHVNTIDLRNVQEAPPAGHRVKP